MPKMAVDWSPQARADLRAIDRYLGTGAGDVKKLQPPRREFRLRVGDYRVLFVSREELAIEVVRVRHRREAYR